MGFPTHDTSASPMCPNVNSIGDIGLQCQIGNAPSGRSLNFTQVQTLQIFLNLNYHVQKRRGGYDTMSSDYRITIGTRHCLGRDNTTPASEYLSSMMVEEGSQGLNQANVQEGNKLLGAIKEGTSVALQTKS
jgi:hypothetical protein